MDGGMNRGPASTSAAFSCRVVLSSHCPRNPGQQRGPNRTTFVSTAHLFLSVTHTHGALLAGCFQNTPGRPSSSSPTVPPGGTQTAANTPQTSPTANVLAASAAEANRKESWWYLSWLLLHWLPAELDDPPTTTTTDVPLPQVSAPLFHRPRESAQISNRVRRGRSPPSSARGRRVQLQRRGGGQEQLVTTATTQLWGSQQRAASSDARLGTIAGAPTGAWL